ncbi:MAG: hypothetical protein PHP29_07840 [Tissierellia bacterium]|nr:hypothetical protein [Tissierellia bacterium]
MIWIKVTLFAGTVVTVKYIFNSINHDGDEKIKKMKELINFTEYLRVYSCDMKMSIEEICERYNFKSQDTEVIIKSMINILKNKKSSKELMVNINKIMLTPNTFNECFSEIINYYGYTYSEVLDRKLRFTIEEMERAMKEFSIKHNEKKTLNNRISFLAGCLAAIIMV